MPDVTLDPTMPDDVQAAGADGVRRWQLCVGFAKQYTGADDDQALDVREFARRLYDSPIPTDAPTDVEEANLFDFERMHPRDRTGKWREVMDRPRAPQEPVTLRAPVRTPSTPGVSLEEIDAMGLNAWPKPSDATRGVLGDATSTAAMWQMGGAQSPGTGESHAPYKAERRALHDKLVGARLSAPIADLLGRDHPLPQKLSMGQRLSDADKQTVRDAAAAARDGGPPKALFMAGGPASGKSSILEANPDIAPSASVAIDCDSVKDDLPEYQALRAAGDHYAAAAAHEESGDVAARVADEARDLNLNVVVDGTGNSEPGAFAASLTRKHDAGYDVSLVYATVPTDEAVRRAVVRAEETGRFVPVPVIREKHAKVSQNFEDVSKLDWLRSLDVFDDTGHIGSLHDGEFQDINPAGMNAFRAKAKEAQGA